MKRFLIGLLAILVILVITYNLILQSENGSTKVLNAITPSSTFSVDKDVSFGEGDRDRIDYYTSSTSDETKPLLVFIHGGGWNRGDKSMYKFLAEGLTSEGYDVALPNYRLHPDAIYPAFLQDNARAISAIHKKYPSRYMVIIGHSAGAYNALMMAFKPEYLEAEGIAACYTVRGIVSLAAPTGVYPMKKEPQISIFPDRLQGEDAPLKRIDQPLPPMLLLNGDEDTSVHHNNSIGLGEALEGRGIATVNVVKGADHVDPVKQFSRYFKGSIKDDALAFIEGLPEDEGDGFCK